ncbi:hypothetical protein [Peribacillus glennii]|uniref:HPr family phosphocarrier protein n=1 Tax=Peribacillus glennii TaxID=2303991 RepID=A0A372LB24_9BACI|nr:hypothetical protein [Peribacillus glennii]RFU62063.1 hypothetical protein D0466_15890 [Peribacillus glennii]
MYEIISSDLKINKKLPITQIMALYQTVRNYDGNVYFLSNHKVIDAAKLSKLVSLMLTLNEKSSIKVVIEGQKVQNMINKVTNCCGTAAEKNQNNYKFYVNPTDTVQIL